MMFAGGPIWGKIYDNYGPRYLILIGTFFNVFGLMMISIRLVTITIHCLYCMLTLMPAPSTGISYLHKEYAIRLERA